MRRVVTLDEGHVFLVTLRRTCEVAFLTSTSEKLESFILKFQQTFLSCRFLHHTRFLIRPDSQKPGEGM
jgi:hypothetical protein